MRVEGLDFHRAHLLIPVFSQKNSSYSSPTPAPSPPPPPLQAAGSARPSFTEFSKIERSRAKTARNRAKKKRRGSFLLKQAVLAKAQRVEEGSAYHLLTVRSERVVRFHATAVESSGSQS